MTISAVCLDAEPIALDWIFNRQPPRWDFGPTVGTPSPAFEKRIRDLVGAFQAALLEADQSGWDGYKAKRANSGAFMNALSLLFMLPSSTPLPEISVDTDGDIALEWDRGARKVFSVRVSRDGTIYYAGLVDYDTFHGSEQLRESVPSAISKGIGRVS